MRKCCCRGKLHSNDIATLKKKIIFEKGKKKISRELDVVNIINKMR
jgi:hypothetical protein